MHMINRRSFLAKTTIAAGLGLAARGLRPSTWAAPAGANDAVRVGVIGLGIKGSQHTKELLKRQNVRVTALCDLDPTRIAKLLDAIKGAGITPFTTTDARKLLERSDVDAVVIATCNHWHALLSVWACQAGKDVYVEKPMTHTLWEGRKMIEAAAKYGRIVQAGTQRRSDIGLAEAMPWLQAGNLGKVKSVHCIFFEHRPSIGKRLPWYPTEVNYDLFCGPTPMVPLERDKLHYDWHWEWNTGNGELGNNGPHLLDTVLRVIPADKPLRRVLSLGGRFALGDAGNTPNTQLAVYDFSGIHVTYEGRGLPEKPMTDRMSVVKGRRTSFIVYCEGGYLAGLSGGIAYDYKDVVIKKFTGDGGSRHMDNFLDAVRARNAKALAAPVEIGHLSAGLCHLANISYRVGAPANGQEISTALASTPTSAKICGELMTHLGVHGIDPKKRQVVLGPWMDVDLANDSISAVSSKRATALDHARYLLHEPQRAPFAIPEVV